jgi:hypothetical protein
MNAVSSRWRRWAMRLAQHAAGVMPGARSPWADAMQRELDYIEHDSAALRWALGCVFASYRLRLADRPLWKVRHAWRQVAVSGALMLLIGFTFHDRADGQTEPPRPALDETTCDPSASPRIAPNDPAGVRRNHDSTDTKRVRSDCADRDRPNRPDTQPDR